MHPLIREEQKKQLKKVPEVRAGYTVRVSQRIKEGEKERIQNFEGLVIKVGHGEGNEGTFTVRKIVEGIGVEKIFPLHSPNVKKIVVIKKAKVRRSKLYYMRERSGKSARLTERHVTAEERAVEEAKMEEMVQEAVKAEEKRKKEEEAANPPAEAAPEAKEEAKASDEEEKKEEEKTEETKNEETKTEEEAPKEPEVEPEAETPAEPEAEEKEAPAEETPEEPAEAEEEKKEEEAA